MNIYSYRFFEILSSASAEIGTTERERKLKLADQDLIITLAAGAGVVL